MIKSKLSSLASIQMGYSFRTRLVQSGQGPVAVIQMKDFLENAQVNCGNLLRIDMENLKIHHLVKKGDLVFRTRGQETSSAIVRTDPGNAVVAAPLLRIRINVDSILPEYLNWYINQPVAQTYLASKATGTMQKMVGKEALEDLEITVPSLEKQKTIIELANLMEKEMYLMRNLILKRSQYVSLKMNQIVKEG